MYWLLSISFCSLLMLLSSNSAESGCSSIIFSACSKMAILLLLLPQVHRRIVVSIARSTMLHMCCSFCFCRVVSFIYSRILLGLWAECVVIQFGLFLYLYGKGSQFFPFLQKNNLLHIENLNYSCVWILHLLIKYGSRKCLTYVLADKMMFAEF